MGVPMELQPHPQLRHHAEHLDFMLYQTQKDLDATRAYANQTHAHIIEQGEAASDVYFLLEGSVEALLRFEGVGDLFMGTLEAAGTLLGWSAFRPPYRYSDSVRSHRPSRLLRVPRSTFEALFERDPDIAHELLRRVNIEVVQQVELTRDLFDRPQAQGQEL